MLPSRLELGKDVEFGKKSSSRFGSKVRIDVLSGGSYFKVTRPITSDLHNIGHAGATDNLRTRNRTQLLGQPKAKVLNMTMDTACAMEASLRLSVDFQSRNGFAPLPARSAMAAHQVHHKSVGKSVERMSKRHQSEIIGSAPQIKIKAADASKTILKMLKASKFGQVPQMSQNG